MFVLSYEVSVYFFFFLWHWNACFFARFYDFIINIIAVIESEVVGSFVIRYKSERFRQNNIVGL